jgi:hypothetical protein
VQLTFTDETGVDVASVVVCTTDRAPSPLVLAIRSHDTALVAAEAPVYARLAGPSPGASPIGEAISSGWLEILPLIVRESPQPLVARALETAVSSKSVAAVRLLMEHTPVTAAAVGKVQLDSTAAGHLLSTLLGTDVQSYTGVNLSKAPTLLDAFPEASAPFDRLVSLMAESSVAHRAVVLRDCPTLLRLSYAACRKLIFDHSPLMLAVRLEHIDCADALVQHCAGQCNNEAVTAISLAVRRYHASRSAGSSDSYLNRFRQVISKIAAVEAPLQGSNSALTALIVAALAGS